MKIFFLTWDRNIPIVGTGVSGGLALGMISGIYTDIPIIFIRKDHDNSHSYREIEAPDRDFSKWAFIDDLTASGDTFKRVSGKMNKFYPAANIDCAIFYNGREPIHSIPCWVRKYNFLHYNNDFELVKNDPIKTNEAPNKTKNPQHNRAIY